jgi:hypothetical protein
VARTAAQISVEVDSDTLEEARIAVGKDMILGMRSELSVYRGDELVVSGYSSLTGVGGAGGKSTTLLNRALDGIPQPGEQYVVVTRFQLFETDVPPQHFWAPEAGRYAVLWTRELRKAVE